MTVSSTPKVFFYTSDTSEISEVTTFHHLLVDLAEGFKHLGIQYYSNNNYWKSSPDKDEFLFQKNPNIKHQDCEIVVLDRLWFELYESLPNGLFSSDRQYITVFMDCSDGIRTSSWLPEFRQFDFIFKTHYIKDFWYPSNVYPWVFGISSRMLEALGEYKKFEHREKKILLNFKYHRSMYKYSHSLRKFVVKTLVPSIQDVFQIDTTMEDRYIPPEVDPYSYLMWRQTGRRHIPSYYKRLCSSQACAAFGGNFLAPRFTDGNSKFMYLSSRVVDELGISTRRIAQWDSWRFWESLTAGCVTFHVDFQKYGFVLPVMPSNWQHYVGIDLNNIQDSIDKICDSPGLLDKISHQGMTWAIDNYSPKAISKRFLETVLDFQH